MWHPPPGTRHPLRHLHAKTELGRDVEVFEKMGSGWLLTFACLLAVHGELTPVIFVPGLGGSVLEAKLSNRSAHRDCSTTADWCARYDPQSCRILAHACAAGVHPSLFCRMVPFAAGIPSGFP